MRIPLILLLMLNCLIQIAFGLTVILLLLGLLGLMLYAALGPSLFLLLMATIILTLAVCTNNQQPRTRHASFEHGKTR